MPLWPVARCGKNITRGLAAGVRFRGPASSKRTPFSSHFGTGVPISDFSKSTTISPGAGGGTVARTAAIAAGEATGAGGGVKVVPAEAATGAKAASQKKKTAIREDMENFRDAFAQRKTRPVQTTGFISKP